MRIIKALAALAALTVTAIAPAIAQDAIHAFVCPTLAAATTVAKADVGSFGDSEAISLAATSEGCSWLAFPGKRKGVRGTFNSAERDGETRTVYVIEFEVLTGDGKISVFALTDEAPGGGQSARLAPKKDTLLLASTETI